MQVSDVIQAHVIARRQRVVLAVEAALVVAAVGYIGPRTAAARVAPMLLFWSCAFAVQLFIYIAVSWDDFADLLAASFTGSAAAMWFVPAILLLSMRSHPAMEAGLALVAATTMRLVSRNAPQKLAPESDKAQPKRILFRDSAAPDVPFSKQAIMPFLGAVAVQVSIGEAVLGEPVQATALMAGGVAIWTWSWIKRGLLLQRKGTRQSHWLLSLLVTLILTTLVSFADKKSRMEEAEPEGTLDSMVNMWNRFVHPRDSKKKMEARKQDRTRDVGGNANAKVLGKDGSDVAPGVILTPRRKQHFVLLAPTAHLKPSAAVHIDKPVGFPFTGDYRVFPASSKLSEGAWAREDGSLLENFYASVAGGTVETIATQTLDPPIDMSNCSKVLVELVNAEDQPFSVRMMMTAPTGYRLFSDTVGGLDRRTNETLEFAMPENTDMRAKVISLAFRRIPQGGPQSMKVDIQRFSLVPR